MTFSMYYSYCFSFDLLSSLIDEETSSEKENIEIYIRACAHLSRLVKTTTTTTLSHPSSQQDQRWQRTHQNTWLRKVCYCSILVNKKMISDQGKECTHMLLCIEKRSIIVFFLLFSLSKKRRERTLTRQRNGVGN